MLERMAKVIANGVTVRGWRSPSSYAELALHARRLGRRAAAGPS